MKRIGIIGAGKVGTSLGFILDKAGYDIALSSRSSRSLSVASKFVPAASIFNSSVEVAESSDVLLIATSDSQISAVAGELAAGLRHGTLIGKGVFHLSGALSIEALRELRRKGAAVGSIHPIQTFATLERAIELLPGSHFGVTADSRALPMALELVAALGGKPIAIADADKPIYHAAACFASNFFVALVDCAVRLMRSAGVPEESAASCLLPLVEGTLSNVKKLGPTEALTGPLARGDVGTVEGHLQTLAEKAPEELPAYAALAERTAEIALRRGSLDAEKADRLRRLLGGALKPVEESPSR